MWLHDVIKLCLLLCLDRRHPIVAEATHCAFNISLWRHFFLWTFSAFTLCHSSILCMTSCMCLMLFTALFFLNIFLFTFWSLHVVHVSFVLVFLLLFFFFYIWTRMWRVRSLQRMEQKKGKLSHTSVLNHSTTLQHDIRRNPILKTNPV